MGANQQVLGSYGGAAPPSFLPSDLSGLQFWQRNQTGLFQDAGKTTPAGIGDPIGCWADQSGNGNDFTGSLTSRPTLQANGAVTFDGSNDVLTALNAVTLKPVTFFCLINLASIAGVNGILGSSGIAGALGLQANTPFLQLVSAATALISTSSVLIAALTPTRIIVTYDGSGNFVWYIGTVAAGLLSGGTGTNDVAIGSAVPQMGNPNEGVLIGGTLKDWGAYNTVYSGANIVALDTYLASL